MSATLSITVDPRMELLAAIQLLAGYGNLVKQETPYKARMREYFSPYTDESAVQIFHAIIQEGTYSDAYPDFALRLSDPPQLTLEEPFREYTETAFRGRSLEFLEAARSFAVASDFSTFFNGESQFYDKLIEDCHSTLGKCNNTRIIEAYFGINEVAYTVILCPLLEGGVGSRLTDDADALHTFSIIGSTLYDKPILSIQPELAALIWHELSHSFVNPLTAKYRALIQHSHALFSLLRETLGKYGYNSWETCVNEHVIRAVTTRLVWNQIGSDAGEVALKKETKAGFPFVKSLCEKLEEYEANRAEYATLDCFYPQLLEVFEEQA